MHSILDSSVHVSTTRLSVDCVNMSLVRFGTEEVFSFGE